MIKGRRKIVTEIVSYRKNNDNTWHKSSATPYSYKVKSMSSNDNQYQYFEYESDPEPERQQRDLARGFYPYADASTITTVMIFLLIGNILVDFLGVFASSWEAVVLQNIRADAYETEEVMQDAANFSDVLVSMVGILQLLATLVVGIVFLCWTYRVCKNAHSLNMAPQATTPGWAVGWYFVPIANLWKPYTALREAFLASCHPDLQREGGASLITFWWWIHILGVVLGNISFRMALSLGENAAMTQLITLNGIQIAGDVVSFLVNGLTLVIVRSFAQCQRETYERRTDDFV